MTEIIDELPRLSVAERRQLAHKLIDLRMDSGRLAGKNDPGQERNMGLLRTED